MVTYNDENMGFLSKASVALLRPFAALNEEFFLSDTGRFHFSYRKNVFVEGRIPDHPTKSAFYRSAGIKDGLLFEIGATQAKPDFAETLLKGKATSRFLVRDLLAKALSKRNLLTGLITFDLKASEFDSVDVDKSLITPRIFEGEPVSFKVPKSDLRAIRNEPYWVSYFDQRAVTFESIESDRTITVLLDKKHSK